MIYRAPDKNNSRTNKRLMGQFHYFLNEVVLKEIHLKEHFFTWSNERLHPTLEQIDRALISEGWEEVFSKNDLHALVSMCSDHAPLLLHTDSHLIGKKHFHFRAFWPKLSGFLDVVQAAWHCPLANVSPFCRLDWLHRNMMHVLQSWSDRCVGNVKRQLDIAKEVVLRLESDPDGR
jgi:hypothetical protein